MAARGVVSVGTSLLLPVFDVNFLRLNAPGVAVLADEGSLEDSLVGRVEPRAHGVIPPGEIAESAIGVTPAPSLGVTVSPVDSN